MSEAVVIGGFAEGLGSGQAQGLAKAGFTVAGWSRTGTQIKNCRGWSVDLTDPDAVAQAVVTVERELGPIFAYIHNPHHFCTGTFLEGGAQMMQRAWQASVLTAARVAEAMLPTFVARGRGAMVFTGATASVRAGASFSAFASAKFALRGLSQSLAREFGPQGVHVCHLLVDGLVDGPQTEARFGDVRNTIDGEAVGEVVAHLLRQPERAWSHELDLRTATETW